MGVFNRRSDPPLGVDIGSASVKVVALSRSGRRYRVDGFAIEPLPPAAVDNGNISDAALVGEALRRACDKARTRKKAATVAVADPAVITRVLLLDADLTPEEMEVEVVLDAERSIPYPIDGVALDFASLGAAADDPARARVLFVVCPKEQVAVREAALAHAGLEAAAVEIESLALRRVARAAIADKPEGGAEIGILDVGLAALRLVAYTAGESLFVKGESVPVSFDDDAAPPTDALLDAGQRLLDAHAAARSTDGDARLLLTGGGASASLASLAAARFGVAVEPARPFAGMAVHDRVDETALASASPVLATACGLGLRGQP